MSNLGKKPKRIRLIKDYRKIAAGEVITRPADCVKELLENSIDAGSSQITVNIKGYGKELIQIIDNGHGISKDDIKLAVMPHYSSKINTIEDLDKLDTLGFRGEALASIAAISNIELITKTIDDDTGTKCFLKEGNIISIESIGTNVGTNIRIKDLFFNTPVRRKFLRSDKIEQGYIVDVLTRYALAFPEIHFKLIQDDITIINSPSSNKQINVIFDLFGKRIAKNVEEFSLNSPLFSLSGFLGDPSISSSTSSPSSTFVNRRFITSQLINNAVKEAFKDYLMVKKFPFFIIFMTIEPNEIDVNIHPTKKNIRFNNETEIFKELIQNLILVVDEKFGRKKKIKSQSSKELPKIGLKSIDSKLNIVATDDSSIKIFETLNPAVNGINNENPLPNNEPISMKLDKMYNLTNSKNQPAQPSMVNDKSSRYYSHDQWIKTQVFPDLKLVNEVGQLNKTYIILEGLDGFYLLDQHAAAERIKFEEELKNFKSGKLKRQRLIIPIKFDIPINEKDFLEESMQDLEKFGFEIDSLGGTTYAIRAIPLVLGKLSNPAIIKDICLEIISIGKQISLDEEEEKIIKYIACHKSLRGGENIENSAKVKQLILNLSRCKNPHHCAHGRPTLLYVSYNELDKLFHRIN